MPLSYFLDQFKKDESNLVYTASMLIEDRPSHRVISVWTMMPIEWKHPKSDAPSDQRQLWDWLWLGVEVDWQNFAKRTGLDPLLVRKLFEPLRANRLLYPDGTAPAHAIGVLKADVIQGLSGAKQRKKQS